MLLFVLSIGLADSINPVTIAVALYLASTPRPVGRLANFAAGVFALYTAGGLLLLFGPASLLRLATHGLAPNVGRVIAIVAGRPSCSRSSSGSGGPSSCRRGCPTAPCGRARPLPWGRS